MKLILGLGNPGQKYAKNRHNLGFMAIDALVNNLGLTFKNCKRTLSWRAEGLISGQKIMLAKPRTFMNNSGQTAVKFARYYKIKPEDIWVIHDDLDLPLGKIRLRNKGSAGGHQGVASLIEYLKTVNFNRLKIGIGSNREKNLPAEIYVLQNFTSREEKIVKEAIKEAAGKIISLL
ncbi:MAG: aminoacyl-tRNA hydrolase [Patescibacteria group bacterium]